MPTIEFDEVCKECGGTGLYKGMGERDGFAVVCHTCQGSGRHHFKYTYEPFVARAAKPGVLRVLQVNPGICVGLGPTKDGKMLSVDDFGGISYDDWSADKGFPIGSEMRNFSCPRQWWQSASGKSADEPSIEKFDCDFDAFSRCKNFHQKHKCWALWDVQRASGTR